MAPFKLRFSKMSKSRSNGSKGSRSNSVECDEPGQQCQPNNSNVQTLASCNSRPETPAAEGSAAGFPDSPPPSYQHVLEETRLKRSTTNTTEEDVEEEDEEEEYDGDSSRERTKNQRQEGSAEEMNNQRRSKSAEIQKNSAGGAGCPGGGGGGGRGGGRGGGEGRTPVNPPEIIHKSSKELYKAVAKQWGITCKMSDQCRCFDCQSHYFDCDYDNDELQKTDGGLSAGTPMFIAEVIHGTACVLL